MCSADFLAKQEKNREVEPYVPGLYSSPKSTLDKMTALFSREILTLRKKAIKFNCTMKIEYVG
jgi:hypothetical protein